MSKYSKYSDIQNMFPYLPSKEIRMSNITDLKKHSLLTLNHGGSSDPDVNLNNRLAPVNKPRFIQDAVLWRDAIRIAELAILPFRYLMQLQYMDTVLDNHIRACLKRREGLQLNRKYKVCDDEGNENVEWTKYLKKTWFKTWLKYVIEAKWYGYTLISMGDLIKGTNGILQPTSGDGGIVMIPRTHISPDRLCVANVPEAPTGDYFLDEPYKNTHIWIPTPDEHGLAACGYGALYEVTLSAISLRNNIFYNEQFLEIFGMPFRWVTTDRLDTVNQERLEAMMEMMGSLGYGILGPNEKMEFIDTGKGGAYKGYGDLENRLEKKISQTLLGHSDAMSSTPGKIGGQQGEVSPQQDALNNIQAEDGDFLCEQVNGRLFTWMRANGINIPANLHFEFSNDFEEKEIEKWNNEQNISITAALVNLVNAGYPVTVDDVQEKTGFIIDISKIAKNEAKADKQVKVDFPSKSQLQNLNTTKDDEYNRIVKIREKEETQPYKGNVVRKRIDEEYSYLTEGIGGDEDGMNKEEYQQYQEDLPDKVTINDLPDGDVGVHPNCQCVIVGGVWTYGDDPCEDCQSLGDEWNDNDNAVEDKMSIYNSHKDLIMKKKGMMNKNK